MRTAWQRNHSRRRFPVAAIVAAVMTVSSAGCLAAGGAVTGEGAADQSPMIIAHRGGAMLRPENTMPAFRHAVDLGVDFLEFDMEMTADDRIVIHHDADINPAFCTPDAGSAAVPGPVRRLSFAETRQFDCGSGVRPAYAGEKHVAVPGARIPALDEVLDAFHEGDTRFFVETKIPKGADTDPVKFATLLADAVREHGLENRIILQSFDFRTIDALHTINPRIRTCLLGAERLTRDYLALLRQHHASCIVLGDMDIDREGVRQLQQAGILVFSDVVDNEDDWTTYLNLGVDAIFTNNPEGLKGFLKKSDLRED